MGRRRKSRITLGQILLTGLGTIAIGLISGCANYFGEEIAVRIMRKIENDKKDKGD